MKLRKQELFCIFAAAALTLLFLYMTAFGVAGSEISGILIAAALGISIWALLHDTLQANARPFRLILSIYLVLFFLLPAFFHVQFYGFPFDFGTYYRPDEILRASIISLLFVVFMHLGYQYKRRRTPLPPAAAPWLPALQTPPTLMRGESMHLVAWILLLATLVLGTATGWAAMLVPRSDTELGSTVGSLLLVTGVRVSAFLGLLYALVGRFSWLRLPIILLSALLFIYVNNPIAVPRFVIAGFVFAYYILLFGFDRRPRRFFVFTLAIGLLTVFPLLSELARGDVANLTSTGLIMTYVLTPDFDGMQSIGNVVKYVDGTGIKFGINLLSALLFFVPRFVWPGKSAGTGLDAAEYAGYDMTNISAPFPSELFVDFGWIGLIVGAFMLGWIACLGDVRFSQRNYPLHWRLAFGVIFGFATILMRGPLVSVIGTFVLAMGVIFAIAFILRVLRTIKPRALPHALRRDRYHPHRHIKPPRGAAEI